MVIIDKEVVKRYYLREDIQQAILECAKDREIAVRFEHGFGKRPEILQYKTDIAEFAKQGALSFHCSEELWHNPSLLSPNLKKEEIDNLRKGWDLVLDIDCPFLEYSQIAAHLLVKALISKKIRSVSVKFSGNHGFHIGVPFEAFPKDQKNYFPEGVKIIARYLQEMIRPLLTEEILKKEKIEEIMKKTGKKFEELTIKERGVDIFDPFKIVSIDSLLISNRHLFRMPYSLNEKSGLVSIPIDHNKILDFKKTDAEIWKVNTKIKFLDKSSVVPNEAKELFDAASEMRSEEIQKKEIKEKIENKKERKTIIIAEALPRELFAPCIKKGLEGLQDGKKRFLFALINYLRTCGWDYDKIEDLIKEWNKRNPEQLKENYWAGQLKYNKTQNKKILPPNCKQFYKDLGLCFPDSICEKIKNPVNYGIIKSKK
ncbi:MAG: hypothetical protein QXG86_01825 [Candidatus Woesearchaeota archaeon]